MNGSGITRALVGAIAMLMPLSAPAMGQRPSLADSLPNVVLILADDLGWGDLGIHGSVENLTPEIDRLARQGVLCTDGYATAPQCLPSRAALMTGKHAQRFGIEMNLSKATCDLPSDGITLAERLAGARVATGLIGKWNLGESRGHRPLDRGYDEFFGFLGFAHRYVRNQAFRPNERDPLLRNDEPVLESEHLSAAFGREAAAFIARHREEPFFLTVAFNAPHTPLQPRDIHRARLAAIADSSRRDYAALVLSLEEGLATVLREIRAQGLDDRTLVFLVGDNGGDLRHEACNDPLRGGKNSLWDGGIRVPWIARWSGVVPAGQIDRRPVSHLDIVPTVLAARGLVQPKGMEGRNRLPRWTGRGDEPGPELLHWRFFGGEAMPATRSWAIREGAWKLSSHWHSNGDEVWLVNLERDMSESLNLASEHPDLVARLTGLWEEWNATLPPPAGRDPAALDPETEGPARSEP